MHTAGYWRRPSCCACALESAAIINKKRPADRGEPGPEPEPRGRHAQLSEKNRLDERTGDVKKIMAKLEPASEWQ